MEPLYSVNLAYFILGDSEKISIGFYTDVVVILGTVIINGILKHKERRKEAI